MTEDTVPLADQIHEQKLLCLGVRNAIDRVRSKEMKRSPEWLERQMQRLNAFESVLATLHRIEKGQEP